MSGSSSNKNLAGGVWPVMLTPFKDDKQIDWAGLDRLVDWYLESGVAGLFAVCGSSEMYELSDKERLRMAERVTRRAEGKVEVVATGTFGGTMQQQADFVRQMAQTGVAAVVCLVNQIAKQDQSDEQWKNNAEILLEKTDNIPLGLYECPNPYHRVLSPELLAWLASSKRFVFLKETSGQLDLIKEKILVVRGTPLSFFNANTATLLESLNAGGDGFSGISANCYPSLFVWLCDHFRDQPGQAERLQQFLREAESVVENKYPTSAKKFRSLSGMGISTTCRICDYEFDTDEVAALEALREKVQFWQRELGLPLS
ncbi:MAG: dihydrodipicolinate synthase family protein [Sedimentisphaerales bacterium]|nr:dihydrodipicolinate synthase family protein [Sedimentisphaerales bacterium]